MRTVSAAIILAVCAAAALPAAAQDAKPLTVEQCIGVLAGLKSLNWAGQQLGEDFKARPADAKQYKLGDARLTIAMDTAALEPILTAYQRSQQGFMSEQPVLPAAADGKPVPPEVQQVIAEQNRAFQKHQLDDLKQPCPVTLGRIRSVDLKIGDGPDQNAIPPSVLGAFSPIVDK